MTSYTIRFMLTILVLPLLSSQARFFTEHHDELEGFDLKYLKPPLPSRNSAPSTGVVAPLLLESLSNYGRYGISPPPPPKPATPVIELITCCASRLSEQNRFWILKNYGKKGKLPPPTPKDAPPTHQVSGGGLAESE